MSPAVKSAAATQMLPRLVWDDPRVHLLDDVWLLTIFAILIAIGLPWFVNGFELQLGAASCGLLALGAIHIVFTLLAEPTLSPTPWRQRALTLAHLLGVAAIGFIWQHAGGLQNPLFLAVFALPVIGAIFLSRWQPYLTALIAMAAVLGAAFFQVPELRWHVSGLGAAGAWLAALFDVSAVSAGSVGVPFSGFYAPARYFIVQLEVFAVLLFACAVAAEYLGTIFERLYLHVRVAREEAARGQELWAMLIEQLPLPALLVDADTLQVVCASEQATQTFCGTEVPIAGRPLFDAIRLSYPETVQDMIVEDGGVVPQVVVRVGKEFRVAQIHVHHLAQKGRRFALLLIADTTEAFAVKAGLDAAEHAALIVDGRGQILALNKPAAGLFASAAIGTNAATLVPQSASGGPWWDPGVAGRRKMHVEISPRIYQVTSSAVVLPGEEQPIYVIAFLPVAKTDPSDQTADDLTMGTRMLVRIR
jgi:hypothetical protein